MGGTWFGLTLLGELGVRIFFVISGFLITHLLLQERARSGKIDKRSFYLRRIFRIFPVFYTYMIVLAVLNLSLNLHVPLPVFLSASLFIQNFALWGTNWFVAHLWSLAVEEQFYLVWPFLFSFVDRLKNVWIVAGMLGLGSLMRSFHYKYPELSEYFLAPFFMHADFLFLGCFLAFMLFAHRKKVVRLVNKANPVSVYLAILALWFFSNFEFHPVYDKIFIPVSGSAVNICIGFLLMYFILKEKTLGYTFLNLPAIRSIGTLSYSLYIWQQLFLSNSEVWVFRTPQNIPFVFAAAWISYTVIEKPFLKLRDRFKPAQKPLTLN